MTVGKLDSRVERICNAVAVNSENIENHEHRIQRLEDGSTAHDTASKVTNAAFVAGGALVAVGLAAEGATLTASLGPIVCGSLMVGGAAYALNSAAKAAKENCSIM